jgi:ATP-dependent DNA helicase 2 subunit 2
VLRLGDVEGRPDEALEVFIKTSKCTAVSRPKGWKKFAIKEDNDEMAVDGEQKKSTYVQLRMKTEYYIDRSEDHGHVHVDDEDEEDDEEREDERKEENLEKVEKEQLVRGFKYGSTYAPCPDGQFPRLDTKKGIDICGFFQAKNVCAP